MMLIQRLVMSVSEVENMATINLKDENSINVNFSSEKALNTKIKDLNYIPEYKEYEFERQTNESVRQSNEVVRQENEVDRIDYYKKLKEKVDNGEFNGKDGLDGKNTVYVGSDTPTDDYYNVWLDENGTQSTVPTKTSDLTNDSEFITNETDDLTNYYKKTEIDAKLGEKQENLVSGTNIKTINNNSLLGSGDLDMRKIFEDTEVITENVVSRNIFNGLLELGNYGADGAKVTSDGIYRNVNMISIKPNTQYTFSIDGVGKNYVALFYDIDKNFINSIATADYSATSPANAYYMNFRCYMADFTSDFKNLKLQIEEGTEVTSYTPYLNLQELQSKSKYIGRENLIIETHLKYGSNFVSYGTYESSVRYGIALASGKYVFQLKQNYYLPSDTAYQVFIVNSSGAELTHYTRLHFQTCEFEITDSEYHYIYIYINNGDAKYSKLTLYENV